MGGAKDVAAKRPKASEAPPQTGEHVGAGVASLAPLLTGPPIRAGKSLERPATNLTRAHRIRTARDSRQSEGSGPWSRDEWDVALNDGAVYRIFRDRSTDAWFIEAIVD